MLSPLSITFILVIYFAVLIFISQITSRNNSNESFFIGQRKSPWYIVAYGMIGASLSGVTFLSVPGMVEKGEFFYMEMVLGFVPGYLFIAYVLMPIYYKMNVYSIYGYLKKRFGYYAHKCGAGYFFLSRLLGASLRLYLVAIVLQELLFEPIGVPFFITTLITIFLIWLYTYRGGIKTIIWTDTLQTSFMLLTVIVCLIVLFQQLGYSSISDSISQNNLDLRIFTVSDFNNSNHFFRSFFAGMFIAIAMTGLDQDMMQKNLSCNNIKEAQKNMIVFSIILVFVNMLFLYLGALLYDYAALNDISPERPDELFTDVVNSGKLGLLVFVLFLLGLISAAYSSADSALTSLTTSFCVDFLGVKKHKNQSEFFSTRTLVHISISLLLCCVILLVNHYITDRSIIDKLFEWAGYTYGPLLGLFTFGIFTSRVIRDKYVPLIVILSPVLSYIIAKYHLFFSFIDSYNGDILNSFMCRMLESDFYFGHDLIIVNGFITFMLLFFVSRKKSIV